MKIAVFCILSCSEVYITDVSEERIAFILRVQLFRTYQVTYSIPYNDIYYYINILRVMNSMSFYGTGI